MLFMDTKYLHDVAVFNVAKTWSACRKLWPSLPINPPSVTINNRLKTTAGRAWLADHRLDFSAELMWQHTQEFVEQIIPHEVAHIIAYVVYSDEGHGKVWKFVMRALGKPADRCHHLVNSAHAARKAKRV
jgi:predicted SprT family Zn-dependent metalloprotease